MLRKFTDNIKHGYKETGKKLDESKKLTQIAMYNSELKKLYSELGALYYKKVTFDEPMSTSEKIIAQIENIKQQLDKLNNEVMDLKEKK
ncbi:hypothetical protein AN639_03165 [Candidatus Epulonipiscium fishelsonii]|uniref:Uncharacterized protein n=1 Tax=Candidatus Epulonipiscium fishelsonii TaxID=77094 RepID=A0ACC8XGM2_9FIRM|nr:hypothetical protein AN639_03165 [Epulopiscium sp. SCG-B05WGA-EpuloA1]ONI42616.1 hypothetical protein AN396_13620 [Epulopiscium sp. SCG-B11WGA-EpuloA1]ONI47238.1 hypothetical protein AN644_01080 [Epulopiscium sp. SCG-C06WGA-EpuloA1]